MKFRNAFDNVEGNTCQALLGVALCELERSGEVGPAGMTNRRFRDAIISAIRIVQPVSRLAANAAVCSLLRCRL